MSDLCKNVKIDKVIGLPKLFIQLRARIIITYQNNKHEAYY